MNGWKTKRVLGIKVSFKDFEGGGRVAHVYAMGDRSPITVGRYERMTSHRTLKTRWSVEVSWASYGDCTLKEAGRFALGLRISVAIAERMKWAHLGVLAGIEKELK